MGDVLKHYGMPRRSGRYPWGSGGDPYQRTLSFRGHVQELRKKGMSDVDIARGEGITTTQLRARLSLEKAAQRRADTVEATRLKDKGYSNMEIGRKMNVNESTVRLLLDPVLAERASVTRATANMLQDNVDSKKFIDVGAGVENYLGVSRTKLNVALAELQELGYKIHKVNVPQIGVPGQFTTVKVLGTPDTQWSEVVKDVSKIQAIDAYSEDYGRSYKTNLGLEPIKSVDSNRIQVKYAEDGGADKDGVIELRRGVSDLDLGASQYAQVRIAVDDTHYLKGMATYTDKISDKVDIIFNTNKHDTGNKLDAMKPLKDDPDNPFTSTIKRQNGALNIVNEEGDWDNWSRTISSQILSKQTIPLAKAQLNLALEQKQSEFDEIMNLTNPVVKKQLLNSFADDCDSSSVHLKAAALPRQANKIILPVPGLNDNEIYAPTYKNGEAVVLIRHPHAGTFEIPQLKVNNSSKEAKSIMANAIDAVGINPKTAKRLSGADFDGDTVLVIPNNQGKVKVSAPLKGLENFDPIEQYKIPSGSSIASIKPKTRQTKMGEVSNLITDMTIKGANPGEIARAVRHSMVVIDSEKHNLDYKQSYIDNGIAALSEKYQGSKRGGASTLISKASSEIRVPERKPRSMAEGGPIDKRTGAKVYIDTGKTYTIGDKIIKKTQISTKMAEVADAKRLSSGRPIEDVYASYANSLKKLANTARKITVSIKSTAYSPSAKKAYSKEVDTLNAKLNIALKNKPLERQAQIIANTIVTRKKQASPFMDNDDLKKVRNQALAEARSRTGAKKVQIEITDREWQAIQSGAVSNHKLTQILQNTDLDRVKQLATPRTKSSLSTAQTNKAQQLLKTGATQAEVADALGISVKALSDAMQKEVK